MPKPFIDEAERERRAAAAAEFREARRKYQLTRYELATAAGVSVAGVQLAEGGHAGPRVRERIATALARVAAERGEGA